MNPLFSDRLPFSTHTLRAFLLCGVLLTLSTTDSHAQTLRERFKRNSASQPAAAMDAATMAAQMMQRHDANGDGLLDRLEFEQIPRIEKKDEVFLAMDADGNLGISTAEVEEALAARFASQPGADDSSLPYSVHRDLVYGKSGHERQKLDVYVPKGEVATPKPVMVFIHGGGWTIGDKRHIQEQPAHFTSKGMVYVTINYRLGPDYIHPALVEDCAEAIAWVHDHIGEYGGDPGKIFVMGHSAG
ncbi:MAG: alpha/beta hydrolase, partial [Candidatus Sumerlaeia bacterium]|nr:alpha/beta hydrolase [Candidatus Sumerlaeia bacterium]